MSVSKPLRSKLLSMAKIVKLRRLQGDIPCESFCWTAAPVCYNLSYYTLRGEASMTETVKIRAIGNSLGMTLPREVLARNRIAEGDTMHVVDTADGFRLVRHDPEFARQMEVARGIIRRRQEVLRELAK